MTAAAVEHRLAVERRDGVADRGVGRRLGVEVGQRRAASPVTGAVSNLVALALSSLPPLATTATTIAITTTTASPPHSTTRLRRCFAAASDAR